MKNKLIENIKYNWCIYIIILDVFLMNILKVPTYMSLILKISSGLYLIKYYFEENYSNKKVLLFLLFLLLIILNFNQIKLNVLYIYLFISTRDRFKNIEESLFNVLLILLIINICLIETRIIKNAINFNGIRLRESYGFDHPNTFSIFYSYLPIYLYRYKKTFFKIFSISLTYIIYMKTNSRTQFLGFMTFVLVLFFLENFLKKVVRKKILVFLKKILVLFLLGVNYIYIYIGLNDNRFIELNKLLSYRLSYVKKVFNSLNVFEYLIGTSEGLKFPIDNSLIILNYTVGVVISNILFMIICIQILKNINRYSNYRYSIIISCLLMGVLESFLLRLALPVSILFYESIFKPKKLKNIRVNYMKNSFK